MAEIPSNPIKLGIGTAYVKCIIANRSMDAMHATERHEAKLSLRGPFTDGAPWVMLCKGCGCVAARFADRFARSQHVDQISWESNTEGQVWCSHCHRDISQDPIDPLWMGSETPPPRFTFEQQLRIEAGADKAHYVAKRAEFMRCVLDAQGPAA